jgi:hypothetical protein
MNRQVNDVSAGRCLVGEFRSTIDAADYQAPGVQQMLGLKMPRGPLAARFKFDAQEVPNLAVHTVPDFARKLAFGVVDAKFGLQRDGLVELKTGSGKRNVFQIRYPFSDAPGLVLPLDIYHIRTQHPGLYTPVEHILLIGERKAKDYVGYATKIALTCRKALTARSVPTEYHVSFREY